MTDTNTSPLILNYGIINNKLVPIELITEALAKMPLGIKGLIFFLKMAAGSLCSFTDHDTIRNGVLLKIFDLKLTNFNNLPNMTMHWRPFR